MDDLTLAQEADHVVHIRIVAQAQDVVIRYARLLLGGHILDQICHRVAGDRHCRGGPRRAGRGLRIDARGMVDKRSEERRVGKECRL